MTAAPLLEDPLLSDAADVRALSGLSGARVVLMTRDGQRWFVRKAAADQAGSARLRRQLAKQLAFGHALDGAVRVPRVLDQGELDGRFYFDMEFVRGMDGVSYLRRASYAEVVTMAVFLVAVLRKASTTRLVWWVLWSSQALVVVADLIYAYQQYHLGVTPFPGWADPFYLAAYLPELVAMYWLIAARHDPGWESGESPCRLRRTEQARLAIRAHAPRGIRAGKPRCAPAPRAMPRPPRAAPPHRAAAP